MSQNLASYLRRVGLLLAAVFALSVMLPAMAVAQEADDGDEEAASSSEDAIKIDVRGSARRVLMPIAVPDALEPAGETGDIADEVQAILRRDLEMSGFFKVIGPDSYFFDASEEGMSTSDIKFQNWFQVGAQALIKSAVRLDGDDVKLDLRLYAVDSGERISVKWSPEPATKENYDQQVHAFVNAIIEHYTGQPGVFGSRITYARRLKNGSKQVYVSQIDGSKVAQITDNSSINMLPSWANGRIYYTSYRAGNPDLWV